MWIQYELINFCPLCGTELLEEFIEGFGLTVKRKVCTNPKCFFVYSKNYGPLRIEVDGELIESIPPIPKEE